MSHRTMSVAAKLSFARPAPTRLRHGFAAGALALSLCACPLSTSSRPDGETTLGVAADSIAPEPAAAVSSVPAAADPTATGPVTTGQASSPNKVTIGAAAPGTATGTQQTGGLPTVPIAATPSSPNQVAATPNAVVAPAPTPSPSTPAATGNITTGPDAVRLAAIADPTATTSKIWPNLAFNNYSGKLGSKVVALTFDDGPDGTGTGQNNTAAVLDFLKSSGIKATFFVCSNVWTDLSTDVVAQADLKRIVAEGHDLGSHTFSHPHLDAITPAQVDQQLAQNLAAVRAVLGPTFAFSKIRAPFGFPFQTDNPNVPTVAPAAAKYGVHIGWGIDTDDWKCAQNNQDANCIMNNLRAQVAAGASGPILMHAVYALTVQTLPQIVTYLQQEGFTFVTAEQLVVDKYNASSAQLLAAAKAKKYTAKQLGAAAASECKNNKIISVLY